MLTLQMPRIEISKLAFYKFQSYIQIAQGEISGRGDVETLKNGDLSIKDLFLFKQITTESNTILDSTALAAFMTETIRTGYDRNRMRVWWHSHGEYGVGWSKDKDERTIKTLSKNNYLISIVGNKQGNILTRLDIQQPIQVTIHGFELFIFDEDNPEPVKFDYLVREVAEKVQFVKSIQERGKYD